MSGSLRAGFASPPRSPSHRDPGASPSAWLSEAASRRTPPSPAHVLRFEYAQTIVHTAVSADTTPRDGAYGDLPAEFLAADTGSSSFSFTSADAKPGEEKSKPEITSLDLAAGTNHVLMGDSNGRVALYAPPRSQTEGDPVRQRVPRFWHQAFQPELDVLRSVQVEERVTKAVLMPRRSPNVTSYMVSNARNIKMYRMREHLARPKSKSVLPVCTFSGPHIQAPIHSLSLCSDEQTFLSADDFQVLWWHIEVAESTKPFTLVDIQPPDLNNVTELLTAASFHPTHGSLFLVSSSDGWTKVGDLRDPPSRAQRQYSTTLVTKPEHNLIRSPHDDILCSVADAAFLQSHFVVTRDYLSVKVWDLRNPVAPAQMLPVHECLTNRLSELYDSDAVFDRFGLAVDQHSGTIVTGQYDGQVAVWQPGSGQPPLYIRANFDDDPSAHGVPGSVLEWSDNEAFFNNRVTNVGVASGGSTIAFSSHDRLFVFDRIRSGGSVTTQP